MSALSALLRGPGALRLFLSLTVVLHHSFPLRLGAWAVYVFFILSGYWIGTMWEAKYRHTRVPLLTFYVSRWWRLAPVFFFCSALGCLLVFLSQGQPPFRDGFGEWALRQIPIAGSSAVGRVLPPTWSLDVEMQFYLVAPLLVLLLAWLPMALTVGLAVLLVGLPALHFGTGGRAEAATLWPWLPFFVAGLLIHRWQWRPGTGLALGSAALALLVLGAIFAGPETRGWIWIRGADARPETQGFLAEMLPVAGALLVLPFVAWNVHQPSGALDRWLGNLAFPLYLFHWIPRDLYYAAVDWSRPAWQNGLLLLANFAAAIVGAVLILHFIDEPLDRRRARWVNGRRTRETGDRLSSKTLGSED